MSDIDEKKTSHHTAGLEELLEHGVMELAPCAKCGKSTKSHLLAIPDDPDKAWIDHVSSDQSVEHLSDEVISLTVICHSCYMEIGAFGKPDGDEEGVQKATVIV